MTEKTENYDPYRGGTPPSRLQPRAATPLGTGYTQIGNMAMMRSAEALRVGDGWLVTVSDAFWEILSPMTSSWPPRPAYIPGSAPQLRSSTTTFFTTMSLDVIKNALFVEIVDGAQGSG